MTRRSPWPLLLSLGVTFTVAVAAIATRDDRVPPPGPVATSGPNYVALGDSFTAGGPIGTLQPGSDDCLRSAANYPSLVAKQLDLSLTDVSCFGATTGHVLTGKARIPAQIRAVNRHTDLVTVSIGGNDLGIYSTIFLTCMRTSRPDAPGAPCRAQLGSRLTGRIAQIPERVGDVLDAVEHRAPKAEILVITYLSLMPRDDTCSATPFTPADVAWFAGVEEQLARAVSTAARERDLPVLDMHAKSADHHVCSGTDAWVNGARPRQHDGILFHPNGAGERAIATQVIKRFEARRARR